MPSPCWCCHFLIARGEITTAAPAACSRQAWSRPSPDGIATTTAVAAGATLSILVDTIPETTEETNEFSRLITVAGFLVAFICQS